MYCQLHAEDGTEELEDCMFSELNVLVQIESVGLSKIFLSPHNDETVYRTCSELLQNK